MLAVEFDTYLLRSVTAEFHIVKVCFVSWKYRIRNSLYEACIIGGLYPYRVCP
jgi:hypothetical protein